RENAILSPAAQEMRVAVTIRAWRFAWRSGAGYQPGHVVRILSGAAHAPHPRQRLGPSHGRGDRAHPVRSDLASVHRRREWGGGADRQPPRRLALVGGP